jgi:hypothetical protein
MRISPGDPPRQDWLSKRGARRLFLFATYGVKAGLGWIGRLGLVGLGFCFPCGKGVVDWMGLRVG